MRALFLWRRIRLVSGLASITAGAGAGAGDLHLQHPSAQATLNTSTNMRTVRKGCSMPSPGLSLVGFLPQAEAHAHLTNACVLPSYDAATLDAEWRAAMAVKGAPATRAGLPNIQPIPPGQQQYIAQLAQQPWVQPHLARWQGAATFAMVEIDPLLAFQFTISTSRSSHHCGGLGQPPTIDELLQICLPLAQPNEPIKVTQGATSVLLRAESLNVQTMIQGMVGPGLVGIGFGLSLPLLHVVRLAGRCYLHNGFHRTLGARLSGATHVPCLLRDVATPEEAGIRVDGATFSAQLLASADPPTLEHFTQGRAHPVQLKKLERFIHVSWAEYVVAMD